MELFPFDKSEGVTFAFDARRLIGANLFSSTNSLRPILETVAVAFNVADHDEQGRVTPTAFIATDSYRLGVVANDDVAPAKLLQLLASDDMQYVLVPRDVVAKIKATSRELFATLTVASHARATLATFKHSLPANFKLADCQPVELAKFADQVSVGHVVQADFPRLTSLFPMSFGVVDPISLNAGYLADYAKFHKLFEVVKKDTTPRMSLDIRGGNKALGPQVVTMQLAGEVQLVSLIMTIRNDVASWE